LSLTTNAIAKITKSSETKSRGLGVHYYAKPRDAAPKIICEKRRDKYD